MPEPIADDRLPHYFDTVTLSNFALCDEFGLLVDRYGASLCLAEQVRVELAEGLSAGYIKLGSIEAEIAHSKITVAATMTPAEASFYRELIPMLGSGEASCITMARHRSGIVVTDDLLARRTCTLHRVHVTGTIGILKAMCTDGHISVNVADALLASMVIQGFHSPVRKVSDLL